MDSGPRWETVTESRPPTAPFRSGPVARLADHVEHALAQRLADDPRVEFGVELDAGASWTDRLRSLAAECDDGDRIVLRALSRPFLAASGTGAHSAAAADVDDVVRLVEGTGFAVTGAAGYGLLFGHPFGGTSALAPLDRTYRWRRALSWLRRDEAQFELAAFIELELVSRLPLSVAPCLMIALAKGSRTPASLAPGAPGVSDLPLARLRPELDRLLEPLNARMFGFAILDQLSASRPECGAERLLTPERTAQHRAWAESNRIDRAVTDVVRGWSRGSDAALRHRTDVTLSTDYFAVRSVLEDYFELFEERPS